MVRFMANCHAGALRELNFYILGICARINFSDRVMGFGRCAIEIKIKHIGCNDLTHAANQMPIEREFSSREYFLKSLRCCI